MAKKKEVKKPKKESKSDFVFVGCLVLGLGIGLYFGRPDVGVLVGLGIGFIAKAILMPKKK